MFTLDCHSLDSATKSLSAIIGTTPDDLVAKLRSYLPREEWEYEPCDMLWRDIVGGERDFGKIAWFHFSRVRDPDSFSRDGILPLSTAIDGIWPSVFDLIGNRLSEREKREFRAGMDYFFDDSWAELYRRRLGKSMFWGPSAMLIRELAQSKRVNHYLSTPEIVEDILTSLDANYGIKLIEEFKKKTTPCIVRFFGDADRPDALRDALFYVWLACHGEAIDNATTFDGRGEPVLPYRIACVERLAQDR